MSFTAIDMLCRYATSVTVDNDKCDFPNTKLDYSCMVSKYPCPIKLDKFITAIFKSGIIDYCDINGVVFHTINIINSIKYKGIYLNNLTSHRIVIACLMISTKLYEDVPFPNKDWAKICHLTIKDVNNMESFILMLLNFDVGICISKNKILAISSCVGVF